MNGKKIASLGKQVRFNYAVRLIYIKVLFCVKVKILNFTISSITQKVITVQLANNLKISESNCNCFLYKVRK